MTTINPSATVRQELPEALDFGTLRRATELALRLGDAGAAWRAAHALLRCCPEAVAPLALLGQALLEAGNPGVAADYLRRALRANPLDAAAWAGLAGALGSLGRHAAAAAALRRAALHDPLGAEALAPGVAAAAPLAEGVVYLRRGMAGMAVAELFTAVERHPRRDDLRAHYAEALRRCGDLSAARRELAELELTAPAGLPALLLRAALAPDDSAASLRDQCARHDPDGALTRRFFAPDPPPWTLPPPPEVPWSEDLEPLSGYVLQIADCRLQTPTLQSHSPAGETRTLVKHARSTASQPQAPSSAADRSEPLTPNPQSHEPDPEVKSFLATAERLRGRLADVGGGPRPLAPWDTRRALTQVILSCRAALGRRLGESGARAVERRLQTLADALRRRGVHAHVVFCDDPATVQAVCEGAPPPAPQEPEAIRELVRGLAAGLAAQGRELGVLLIVGGDEVVPFHRLPNPIPDDDTLILSDNPYACDDAGHLVPQRVVARLPEGADPDPELLLAIIENLIEHHHGPAPRSGLAIPSLRPRPPAPAASFGYAAEVWQEPSRQVLGALGLDGPVELCPPLEAASLDPRALAGRRVLYLNLHGAQGLPNFYGQPEEPWPGPATKLPVALRPDQLGDGALAGGVLLTEACYGAELAGRTPENSIPLRALAGGALACVGATVNAYGSTQAPLVAADLLFHRMIGHLGRGAPVGEALHHARLEFAQEMYRRQGFLDDADVKTLVEFVLLGDPWAALDSPAGRPVVTAERVVAVERVPKPRPKAVLTERDIPRELVQRAREALGRAVPGAARGPLLITAQPNPRRQRKGDADQSLVFSAREQRIAEDGARLPLAAHVTMSGKSVVKLVITR